MLSAPNRMLAACVSVAILTAFSGVVAVAQADTAAVWAEHCASCHGEDGRGATKVGKLLKISDYTDPAVQAGFVRADLATAIQDGVKNAKGKFVMKGYADKVDSAGIEALVDYVLAFGGAAGTASAGAESGAADKGAAPEPSAPPATDE